MKAARLVVFGIAAAAGIAAWMLASGPSTDTPPPVVENAPPALATVEVLVAAGDIPMGTAVRAEDVRWQAWPKDAANPLFLVKDSAPKAIEDTTGAITRSPLAAGEPIRPDKLIKGNGSGYMAAILPAGMRAISIEISPETSAGGFILPNDRVDVILTRKTSSNSGRDQSYAETINQNVRVLAIDQTVEDKDGQKVVVGKTATLELSPSQAEQIALSRQQGVISLALRSLVDSSGATDASSAELAAKRGGGAMSFVRFGVPSSGAGH